MSDFQLLSTFMSDNVSNVDEWDTPTQREHTYEQVYDTLLKHKAELYSVSASLNKYANILSQSFRFERMFFFLHECFVGIIQMLNKLQLGKLLRFRRVTMTMRVFWFVVVPWLGVASNHKAITVCRFPPTMYIRIPADYTKCTSKDLHANLPNIVCNNLYELWVAVESTIHSKLIGNTAYKFRFLAIHK